GGQGVAQRAAAPAAAAFAASVRSCHAELDRNDFPERCARLVIGLVDLSVDVERAGLFADRRRDIRRSRSGTRYSDSTRHGYGADPRRLHKIPSRIFHRKSPYVFLGFRESGVEWHRRLAYSLRQDFERWVSNAYPRTRCI